MESNVDYVAIGQRIKNSRIQMGLTQEELAEAANLSVTYISNIENVHTKVSLPTLVALAQILNVSVDYLLYDNLPAVQESCDARCKQLFDRCSEKKKELALKLLEVLANTPD